MKSKYLFLVVGILVALPSVAQSAVVGGASSSEFARIDLTLSLLAGGVVTDADASTFNNSASAPAPYSVTPSVASQSLSANVIATSPDTVSISSGAITSELNSDVDMLPGSRVASSQQVISNLNFALGEVPVAGLNDVISITADTITVFSSVSGNFNALSSTGAMNVENLAISVGGSAIDLSGIVDANGDIAVNTLVPLVGSLAGVSLVLNEQSTTGNGIEELGLQTSAISLQIDAVAISDGVATVGDLSGITYVGRTNASLNASAVPEPSSLAILGIASLGGVIWKRRHRPVSTEV